MHKNFTKVGDLFTEDFFVKLKSFIFDESFDDFYKRRSSEFRSYAGYDEQIWYPIEEDMVSSDIYPISFDDFLSMYKNIGCCTYFIDKSLFCIKFFIEELFENSNSIFLNNDNFFIKINKNIILNQYDKVFDTKFLDIKLSYITRDLGVIIDNKNSIDLLAQRLICYPFEFIQTYLENFADKLLIDNDLLINSYCTEVKYKFLSISKNKTKDENYWANDLKEKCKKERNRRFTGVSGNPEIEITGYFPKNFKGLKKEIKRLKSEYDSHPYIAKQLRKIKKGENPDIVRQNIYAYLKKEETETKYLSLDNEIQTVNEYGLIDCSPDLLATIENYIKIASLEDYKDYYYICSISNVIRYTLLEKSEDIKLFKLEKDFLKVINTFFSRRKNKKSFFNPIEVSKIYNLPRFKEKYQKFFNY